MTTTLEYWLEESEENKRLFAQEQLILAATEAIWAALERKGMSKADLARVLGTSKANVTQLLNGGRNLTLRTLSDIARALGQAVSIELRDETATADDWQEAGVVSGFRRLGLAELGSMAANDSWTPPTPLREVSA